MSPIVIYDVELGNLGRRDGCFFAFLLVYAEVVVTAKETLKLVAPLLCVPSGDAGGVLPTSEFLFGFDGLGNLVCRPLLSYAFLLATREWRRRRISGSHQPSANVCLP